MTTRPPTSFTAKMGADAVLVAIEKVNLEETSTELERRNRDNQRRQLKVCQTCQKIKLIDGLRRAKINPSWMILRVFPVLPPDLRPMVQLSGGRFATSDLNDLYRRVINRNNRLKASNWLGAPEIILRNEKRMLQEAVDSLIDASQRKATRKSRGRQPLRSLTDMLRGKQGRFRQNLLVKESIIREEPSLSLGPNLNLPNAVFQKKWLLKCLSRLF